MAHKRETLLAAIVTQIKNAATSVGNKVYRGRHIQVELDELPVCLVYQGDEQSSINDFAEDLKRRMLDVHVDLHYRGDSAVTPSRLVLPGASGNYASSPDTALNSFSDDIDLRVKLALDNWDTGTTQYVVGKWGGLTDKAWSLFINNSTIWLSVSANGSSVSQHSFAFPQTFADGVAYWLRVTFELDVAGQYRATLYTSANGESWTQAAQDTAGSALGGIYDADGGVEIGSVNAGATGAFAGTIYFAQVRSGIDGTIVAEFDPADGEAGATSVTGSETGETWTIAQSGSPGALLEAVNINAPDIETRLNNLAAEIEDALEADITFGGVALKFEHAATRTDIEAGEIDRGSIRLDLVVDYRTTRTNASI